MTDQTYTGFRFQWDRSDVNSPRGVFTMHCLVIARALPEAQAILEETVTGSSIGVKLISSGPDVLEQARLAGLREGEGKAL